MAAWLLGGGMLQLQVLNWFPCIPSFQHTGSRRVAMAQELLEANNPFGHTINEISCCMFWLLS